MGVQAMATVDGVTTGHRRQALRRAPLLRLRARSWPILQTAGAAVVAWYLATLLVAEDQPVFAAIAAVVALGATYGQRPERAIELLGGGPLLVTEAAVTASLLVLLEPTGSGMPPSRLIEAIVGGGVALAVSALA